MRAILFGLLLLTAAAVGCGGETTDEASPPPTTPAQEAPLASDRPPAPAIEGTSLENERISLEGFRGRPVLINVWSSW